ncbi:RNA polymerase sigma-70 factor [Olivibacter ginsenosidimutans]|uniref:RNA polymerase sigma-70 factor n=1 Tax=Olivibacter ginsenosidimutans TaxID=1176537 RepID=A0ABP9BRS1_9SPHI
MEKLYGFNRLNQVKTDLDLWKSTQAGDRNAYHQLFNRHWEMAYVRTFHLLKDAEESQDIVHNIFVNIWIKREQLEIREFQAYVRNACRYHAYKYLKTRYKEALTFMNDQALRSLKTETVINSAEYNERLEELSVFKESLLKDLPKRCQEIFSLSRDEQLSNQEISHRLNISKRTVENQITYALKHIRLGLKRFLML